MFAMELRIDGRSLPHDAKCERCGRLLYGPMSKDGREGLLIARPKSNLMLPCVAVLAPNYFDRREKVRERFVGLEGVR